MRIGAPDGCANFLLPQVVAPIVAENPGLEVQIVALPRVFNLNRREADMAIGVSAPAGGRLTVQKIVDYHLVLACAQSYLACAPAITRLEDLGQHRLIGYIPEMIFDKELDYLGQLGVERPALTSNSVAVQLQMLRQGAGIAMVHDFALATDPSLVPLLPQRFSLRRSFYLIRHEDDSRVRRLSRFAEMLVAGMRRETNATQEALTELPRSANAGASNIISPDVMEGPVQ